MVWMKMVCFCCSVRLGVIVCATISLIHAMGSFIVLFVFGMSILNAAKYFIRREEQYNEDMFLWKLLDALSRDGSVYVVTLQLMLAAHIINTLLAMYGAVKKWLLIPYVVSQSVLAVGGMTQHVISMMILKNIVSLELLVGYTLSGAAFMLFLAYSGATAVSMFQIIVLINSEEYKTLYGQNPFAPTPNCEGARRMMKDVKIYSHFVPSKKEVNRVKEMICKQREGQAVIPVKPVDTLDEGNDVEGVHFSNWHSKEVVCVEKGLK